MLKRASMGCHYMHAHCNHAVGRYQQHPHQWVSAASLAPNTWY